MPFFLLSLIFNIIFYADSMFLLKTNPFILLKNPLGDLNGIIIVPFCDIILPSAILYWGNIIIGKINWPSVSGLSIMKFGL